MNLRDVLDEVYAALAGAAEAKRQSLSALVVDRLTEAAQVTKVADYVAGYPPLRGSGVTLEEAAAAMREAGDAS